MKTYQEVLEELKAHNITEQKILDAELNEEEIMDYSATYPGEPKDKIIEYIADWIEWHLDN